MNYLFIQEIVCSSWNFLNDYLDLPTRLSQWPCDRRFHVGFSSFEALLLSQCVLWPPGHWNNQGRGSLVWVALLRQLRGVFWHSDNLHALLLFSYPNSLAIVTVSSRSDTLGSPAYCRIPYGNTLQGLSKTWFLFFFFFLLCRCQIWSLCGCQKWL